MLSDFHLHSQFSGDCDTPPEEIVQKAITLGMSSLCFTDHQDFDYSGDMDFNLDTDSYYNTIYSLKDKYARKIQICIGAETGLEPNLAGRLDDFIGLIPFDFIIGSSHLVNRIDPYYKEYWDGRTDDDAFQEYFYSIIESLKTCRNFDVYGHLDYVIRYSPNKDKNFSYQKYSAIIDEILKTLIYMGKGIELNTGGLARGLSNPNPHPDIIRRYNELGGEIITIGSDAHIVEHIGYRFDDAKEILQSIGFKYYTIFKQRKSEFIRL